MRAKLNYVRCFECNGYADAELKVLCQCGWTNREDGKWRCPTCSKTPAPTWTTTPPTEPGKWFWWRVKDAPGELFTVLVLEDDATHLPLYSNGGITLQEGMDDFVEDDMEFWPEAIKEPPTTGKDGAA